MTCSWKELRKSISSYKLSCWPFLKQRICICLRKRRQKTKKQQRNKLDFASPFCIIQLWYEKALGLFPFKVVVVVHIRDLKMLFVSYGKIFWWNFQLKCNHIAFLFINIITYKRLKIVQERRSYIRVIVNLIFHYMLSHIHIIFFLGKKTTLLIFPFLILQVWSGFSFILKFSFINFPSQYRNELWWLLNSFKILLIFISFYSLNYACKYINLNKTLFVFYLYIDVLAVHNISCYWVIFLSNFKRRCCLNSIF